MSDGRKEMMRIYGLAMAYVGGTVDDEATGKKALATILRREIEIPDNLRDAVLKRLADCFDPPDGQTRHARIVGKYRYGIDDRRKQIAASVHQLICNGMTAEAAFLSIEQNGDASASLARLAYHQEREHLRSRWPDGFDENEIV